MKYFCTCESKQLADEQSKAGFREPVMADYINPQVSPRVQNNLLIIPDMSSVLLPNSCLLAFVLNCLLGKWTVFV